MTFIGKKAMEYSKKIVSDINQFMQESDLNEVYMFGGAVLDVLTQENPKINDYDLCVKNQDEFYATLQTLEQKGVEISEVMRTHNIYTVIHHPKLGQIDFSCMDPEDNGIFNIEKIYAQFRRKNGHVEAKIIDKYGAVDGIKRGEIRISCNQEKEGAYNILRRFLANVGKYGLDISKNGRNQNTIAQINKLFAAGYHYIPQDKVRCLSRVTASLKRSSDRKTFVQNIGEQKMFQHAFPDLHKLFNNPLFQNCEKLKTASSQKELLELMLANVDFKDRDAMVDCLMLLSKREKARQDKGVREFVEDISSEKTSPQRLAKSVLNPVFQYILANKGKAQ